MPRLAVLLCAALAPAAAGMGGADVHGTVLEHDLLMVAQMPGVGLAGAAAVATEDNKALLFGGCTGFNGGVCTISRDIVTYNPKFDTYTTATNKLRERSEGHSATVHNGVAYIFGGGVANVEMWNIASEELDTSSSVSHQAFAVAGGAAFTLNGVVYYCTTQEGCRTLDGSQTTPFPEPSTDPLVAAVDNDLKVAYLLTKSALYEFTESAGFSNKIAVPSEGNLFSRAGVAVMHNRLYVFGGEDGNAVSSAVWVYSPRVVAALDGSLGAWHRAGELPGARSRVAAVHISDGVYIFGGRQGLAAAGDAHRYVEQPGLFEQAPIPLHGSGTTNPSRFFWKWMGILTSRAKLPLHLTYRGVGSSTGMSDFVGPDPVGPSTPRTGDFACGDIPLEQEHYVKITASGREVLHVPFALGTISVFVNLPISWDIRMSPCTLAKVYNYNITTWDDDSIKADNPEKDFTPLQGKAILLGKRAKGSSSTFGLTEYGSQNCPGSWRWPQGADALGLKDLVGPNVNEQQGSSDMTHFIKMTPFAIGYLDSGHGISNNLKEVELQLGDGTYAVSNAERVDVGSAASNVVHPRASEDWSQFALKKEFPAWPITMVSYFYLHKDMTGRGIVASLLRAFLETVLSDEAQKDMETFGFKKLPPTFLASARDTVTNLIDMPLNAPVFRFEESTLDKGRGMDDYVISVKRNPRPFDFYVIQDEVADSQKEVQELKEQVQALQTTLNQLASGGNPLPDTDKESDSNYRGVSIAALVIALLAVILAGAAMWKSLHPPPRADLRGPSEMSVQA